MSEPVSKPAKITTKSEQEQKKKKLVLIFTVAEVVLIAILSVLNIISVNGLVKYDPYYKLYYAYSIAGLIMIITLVIAYFRKWVPVQLLSVIVVLLWTTYCAGTIYSCQILTHVKKLEAPYMHADMYVVFEGKTYTWDGNTIVYGLPAEWEDLKARATIVARDDSKMPTEELNSKGVDAGCVIFYQNGYKYILVEVVNGSLFEFIDPNDPPEDTNSTATTTLGLG